MKLALAAVAGLVLISPAAAQANSVDSAYKLCSVFDSTGMLSKKCEVSGWASSVDVSIDTTSTEARKICQGVAQMVRGQGIAFDRGWQIRIYSPFSGDQQIAYCSL
jgi:hypothetical protein